MGSCHQENQPCDWRVVSFGLTSLTSGQKGWKLNRLPPVNDLIKHVCVLKPPKLAKRTRLESFWVSEHTEDQGQSLTQIGWELRTPFSITCRLHLFYLGIPKQYPFIINQKCRKQNVSVSSISCSSKFIKPTQGVLGTSNQ